MYRMFGSTGSMRITQGLPVNRFCAPAPLLTSSKLSPQLDERYTPVPLLPPLVTLPAAAYTVPSSGFTATAIVSRFGGSTNAGGEIFFQIPAPALPNEQLTDPLRVWGTLACFPPVVAPAVVAFWFPVPVAARTSCRSCVP